MPDEIEITYRDGELCKGIPASKADRDRLRRLACEYIDRHSLVPPVPLDALKNHASEILKIEDFDAACLPFAVVVLNNELWRPQVETIPFDKRLLLLPQCLRHSEKCPADVDQLGLLCKHCGRCVIDHFTAKAETLGYAVLVAEGSPVVMAMIESGQVQCTIGVSCLEVLERVFPYMEAGAVPGIAVPLLKAGCKDTIFDADWLEDILPVFTDDSAGPVNLPQLKQTIQDWFEPAAVSELFGQDDGHVGRLVCEWMAEGGKRYRPVLTAGIYAVLTGTAIDNIPDGVRRAAVAVECFHKASLIHDDIEDNDAVRYDKATLHETHGVPIALNAGDYLIGQGYRLLAELECDPAVKVELLRVAAKGHRQLCIGQGAELKGIRDKHSFTIEDVIDIFSKKTAPAFAVALKIGAILAKADPHLLDILDLYSHNIGVAYQIRDDIHDWKAGGDITELSIIHAISQAKQIADENVVQEAQGILADYRKRAIDGLKEISNSDCKAFLRKIITKIFDGAEGMGCCDEHPDRID